MESNHCRQASSQSSVSRYDELGLTFPFQTLRQKAKPCAYGALKLLVVEDDAASLELMAELLQQFKAEVRPISDSQEAPALIQREKFDGIFLDLKMPILSGFELAKLVRESACNKATPLVIVTGRDEQDTMHLSFSLGATYFLQKPIDTQKLAPRDIPQGSDHASHKYRIQIHQLAHLAQLPERLLPSACKLISAPFDPPVLRRGARILLP
jgi:CheY-like chemotaxis protein